MNALGIKMLARGRAVGVPPSFPYTTSALANLCRLTRAAQLFIRWLDAVGRAQGFLQADLLTHSNGGIIVLLAADLVARGEARCGVRFRKVVTMACPYRGVPVARLLWPLIPCCQDVRAGAAVLARVERVQDRVTGCLVAGKDALVPPENQTAAGAPWKALPSFQHMDFIVGTAAQLERAADEALAWLSDT